MRDRFIGTLETVDGADFQVGELRRSLVLQQSHLHCACRLLRMLNPNSHLDTFGSTFVPSIMCSTYGVRLSRPHVNISSTVAPSSTHIANGMTATCETAPQGTRIWSMHMQASYGTACPGDRNKLVSPTKPS